MSSRGLLVALGILVAVLIGCNNPADRVPADEPMPTQTPAELRNLTAGSVSGVPTLVSTNRPEPTPSEGDASEPAAQADQKPRLTITPVPTPTDETQPTRAPTTLEPIGPLTPAEVFDKAAGSVAFVTTKNKAGSGVLIGGGFIVTSAHVVWPFDDARITFPDGSEYLSVPVKGWTSWLTWPCLAR